jgi:hypothetical protein
MFGKKHKQIISKLIQVISNTKDKTLINDYFTLHTVLMAMYARNIFKYNSNWDKLKISYRINYSFIREYNTSYLFTDIEKNIKNHLDKFIKHNEKIFIDEFIDYIRYCMKMCINYIAIPFIIMSPKIKNIIDRYKNDENIIKYIPKSKKLNYDVLDKLQIKL